MEVWKNVQNKNISYEGEECLDPLPLSVKQIERTLPPKGHGGSVTLIDWLVGKCRHLMLRPQELLVEKDKVVPGANTAKVHISGGGEGVAPLGRTRYHWMATLERSLSR